MTLEQLNTALYEKVYAEQQEFISLLKNMTPENIIQYAYELVIREDILLSLSDCCHLKRTILRQNSVKLF